MQRLLPLFLFSVPLSAQVQQNTPEPWNQGGASPCLDFAPDNTLEWPTGSDYGAPSALQRVTLADLNGDQDVDALVVSGGQAVVLWNPTVYDAFEPVQFPTSPAPAGVSAAVTVPGAGPGGADAVALTDARGIFLVVHDGVDFLEPVLLEGSAWKSATSVHADDLDGDGDIDLYGIAANGTTIVRLLAGPGGFQSAPSLLEPLPVKDVVAVEWDALPGRELVVLTNRGLLVHASSGTVVATVPHLSSSGCIARFRATDVASGELLAWTRASAAGTGELVVRGSGLDEGPLPLAFDLCGAVGSVLPRALVTGDYDGNGSDELLLVHDLNETAIVLRNLALSEPPPGPLPGPHFDPSDDYSHDVIPLAELPATPGVVGLPAFAQVDGVDSDDLVFPVASTGMVEVFLHLPAQRALGLTAGGSNSGDVISPSTEFGPGPSGENRLRLGFRVPNRFLGHTFAQVILWEESSAHAGVSPVALSNRLHPLLGGGTTVAPAEQWIDVEWDFWPGDCWTEPKPHYYVVLRFVHVDPAGQEEKSPAFIGGFTLETCGEETTDYSYLVYLGIPGTSFDLFEHNGLTESSSDGASSRELLGLYVPMSAQPPFIPGTGMPVPGDRLPGAIAFPFLNQ